MNEAERRRWIRERPRKSTYWYCVHLLGSLKLAVILLLTVAAACAAATIYESKFNTAVAQYYIYKNPLFTLWLLVLCLNLLCAALTRWPWQSKHTGFVVTHAGIIILLFGAMIGRILGWEASVTLRKGDEPASRLIRNETLLLFQGEKSGEIYTTPLEVAVRQPSENRPRRFEVPESDAVLVVDGYSENLAHTSRVVEDATGGGVEGISLLMTSNQMGQRLPVSLLKAPKEAAEFSMFGLAKIELVEALPKLDSAAGKVETYRETQMVFLNSPESPVIHNTNGKPSGYRFLLERGSGSGTQNPYRLLSVGPSGRTRSFSMEEILGKAFAGEESSTEIHVVQFWKGLQMAQGKPIDAAPAVDNPAVLITLSGFLNNEKSIPVLSLARQQDGSVAYRVMRDKRLVKDGVLKLGESFPVGWADWSVTLEASHEKARLASETQELTGSPLPGQQVVSGVRAHLEMADGVRSDSDWLASGTSRVLHAKGSLIRVGFGMRPQPLPFRVALEEFEVPMDPGTQTPANFISTVRFSGQDTGQGMLGRIEMNHPASYPEGWWRSWLGSNYKFSQAGWDPQNRDQTTLQVLHDPGWPFKWIGSLCICCGIFAMFYIRPSTKGKKADPGASPADAGIQGS